MATGTRAAPLAWRPLVRRQWPLALGLALLLTVEAGSVVVGRGQIRAWQVPVLAGVTVLAVLAPRYPLRAAGATSVLLAVETAAMVVGPAGPPLFTGIAATEMAATMAVLATAARHVPARAAAVAAIAVVVDVLVAAALRPTRQVAPPPAVAVETGRWLVVVLLGLAICTGLYLRARDRDHARALDQKVAAARQGERLALARELHDLVAHHVTGMLVQAKAARVVADADPGAPRRVLSQIEAGGAEAMAAMRRLVDALRRAEATDDHALGPGARTTLVEQTGDLAADLRRVVDRAGLPVELCVELPGRGSLPPEISAAALRLVTESLTNVTKHAPTARAVHASVRLDGHTLRVEVTDDGLPERLGPRALGYGLIGMQERVALLDGALVAGPVAPIGWRVSVELPVVPPGGTRTEVIRDAS